MPRQITSATSLDNLRKEAKRWFRALRANDPEARDRFRIAYPGGPDQPVLRDVQHALAREYGEASWIALRQAIGTAATESAPPEPSATPVQRFLECACPDHHVRGGPAHQMATHAAMRILQQNPAIARDSIYTAVVCGEIEEVERLLRADPRLANARHPEGGVDRSGAGNNYDFLGDFGAKPWEPLLYLCFTRLSLPQTNHNAVAIARLLLDHGADPNAYFMAGDSRYTPLVGVIGEGEENRPAHPHRDELARLLLERGAMPFDSQVVYNIHFHGKVLWWLKLMYEFSAQAGRRSDWNDPEWRMLDMGGYGSGARYHLAIAVNENDLELTEWCLSHGANPNAATEKDRRFPQQSLYEMAVRTGHREIAELLARHGAERREPEIADDDRFVAACLRLDREEVRRLLALHPEYLTSTKAMFAAARQDRADVVAFLLDLGMPVEVQDEKEQRTLHVAASQNAVEVAKLLIERGAEIDHYELNFSSTPIDFALWGQHHPMIDLLRKYSRDVWSLVPIGDVQRLREIITADPRLAKATWQTTLLFWLPDDDEKAREIAQFLLEHGADAAFRSKKDGSTAADVARKRGLCELAALLDAAAGSTTNDTGARREHLRQLYEQLARDLVTVNESDDEAALDRLARQFNRILSFEDVRGYIRRHMERLDLERARDLIAQQSGFRDWARFLESLGDESPAPPAPAPALPAAAQRHEQAAQDLINAYARDTTALQRLNEYYGRTFTLEDVRAEIWRRVYAFRQRSWHGEQNYLMLDEARLMVAQDAGFSNWDALLKASETGAPPPGAPYAIDSKENRIGPRRRMSDDDWNELISAACDHRVTGVDANGLMTDHALARIADLEHVTSLNLGGSRELTDDGLLHLARMPQLERLNLSEYPGGKLTDRGLEVLRHLPNLRSFDMTWQAGISDAGVSNLRFCERLESVNLMGSPTGDGAIEALQGKPSLRRFSTGRLVTDAGLPFLHQFPMLKKWHGEGPPRAGDPAVAKLLIDGPFTDGGLASLAGLEGVCELDLFWHVDHITSDGFVHLAQMPNLVMLGCDGQLSDDTAMRHIASIPRLQALRAQESVATDDGFVSLSQSKTLERFWGRVCPNFGSRGFRAFSTMPSLRILGVGCKNVDDAALSSLPDFPALRELTPIGFLDDGFRHVGRCTRLERLTCMYCRETTDIATGHIEGLAIRYYYAGLTQITDRSLEILGRMPSLEQIEFYECKSVTDAGLPFLAVMPNLREVHLDGLPGVTLEGTKVFPAHVRVYYST